MWDAVCFCKTKFEAHWTKFKANGTVLWAYEMTGCLYDDISHKCDDSGCICPLPLYIHISGSRSLHGNSSEVPFPLPTRKDRKHLFITVQDLVQKTEKRPE